MSISYPNTSGYTQLHDDYDDDLPIDPIEGLREIPAAQFPSTARSVLTSNLIHKVHHTPDGRPYQNMHIPFDKTLAPRVRRPDALYPTPYETMRAQYFDHEYARDNTSDQQLITDLLKGQPYRIPTALAPEGHTACQTLGPLLLPESADPLATAPHAPIQLPQPKPWSPESTNTEVIQTINRELLDITCLAAARIKTATGHQPDAQTIHQLEKLTNTLYKNLRIHEKLQNAHQPQTAPVNPGGRPPKATNNSPDRLVQLTAQRTQSDKNRYTPKKHRLTPAESNQQVPETHPSPTPVNSFEINPKGYINLPNDPNPITPEKPIQEVPKTSPRQNQLPEPPPLKNKTPEPNQSTPPPCPSDDRQPSQPLCDFPPLRQNSTPPQRTPTPLANLCALPPWHQESTPIVHNTLPRPATPWPPTGSNDNQPSRPHDRATATRHRFQKSRHIHCPIGVQKIH